MITNMASPLSSVDGQKKHDLKHSDELLHAAFISENSRFLITKESKCNVKSAPPDISKMEPSSVLKRVKSFLPKMKEAEKILEKEIQLGKPSSLDIEAVDETSPYIEMNLALVETQTSDNDDDDDDIDYSCKERNNCQETDLNYNCQIGTYEISCGPVTEENFVISRTRDHAKPMIEVVAPNNSESVKKIKKRKKSGNKRRTKR